jgi:type I restriction enzyme, S subunit
MAVKAGYKQTEVGIIPEDWEVKTYGDIFDFLTTATYSRAELTEVDDVKYVHYGDIHTKWNFFLDVKLSNLPTIRDTQVKKYNLLKDGDIIMADASEDYTGVGKSVEVKNLGLVQAISGQHTFLLRDKNEVFVNGFRGYIHFIKAVKTQFDQLATGLKVYSVSKGNLKVVKIPVPTKLEQTLIATALSDADALISTLKNLIDKKRIIKQGAIQNLLNFQEGWQVRKFNELCWFQEGPGLRNWQFTKRGIKVINVTNLENGILNLERTDRHISLDEFHKMYEHFEIEEHDIVVASSGNSYGKVAVVRKQDLPLLMNTSVIRFKPLKELDYNYLLVFLKSSHFKNQIDLLITGGAQPNFGPVHLNKISISIPSTKAEQIRIATILSDMDAEISALVTKLEKYRNIKQGMMQNLLTGKIRLV